MYLREMSSTVCIWAAGTTICLAQGAFGVYTIQASFPGENRDERVVRPMDSTSDEPRDSKWSSNGCAWVDGVAHVFSADELPIALNNKSNLVVISRGIWRKPGSAGLPSGIKAALLHEEVLPILVDRAAGFDSMSSEELKGLFEGTRRPAQTALGSGNIKVVYNASQLERRTIANQLRMAGFPDLKPSSEVTSTGVEGYDRVLAEAAKSQRSIIVGFLKPNLVSAAFKTIKIDNRNVTDAAYPFRIPVYIYWRDTAEGRQKKAEAIAAIRERAQ